MEFGALSKMPLLFYRGAKHVVDFNGRCVEGILVDGVVNSKQNNALADVRWVGV